MCQTLRAFNFLHISVEGGISPNINYIVNDVRVFCAHLSRSFPLDENGHAPNCFSGQAPGRVGRWDERATSTPYP